MVLISAVAVAVLVLLGAYGASKADDAGSAGSFATYAMYAIYGFAALFVVQRCLLLPSKAWVRFDDGSLTWRTHKSLVAQEVSPSGTVLLRDIMAASVIVQHPTSRVLWNKRQVEMRSVRLELASGERVVLPVRGLAAHLVAGSPFSQLVDELRRRRPEFAQGLSVAVAP
ncbi:hypothetical protein [Streptomyces sp. NPDC048111]|uniref:hypothetical protein n=1 Tax=Streptomyces sp. NPDC048111 TaxID=3365500 RepID=UPI00371A4EDB